MTDHVADIDWMCGRALITARNATVDKINDIVLQLLPGETHTYRSCGKFNTDNLEFPLEFIHAQTLEGSRPRVETQTTHHCIAYSQRGCAWWALQSHPVPGEQFVFKNCGVGCRFWPPSWQNHHTAQDSFPH